MFKIQVQARSGKKSWLATEYYHLEDAEKIAKHLIDRTGEVQKTRVIEQAGHVYAEYEKI